ncbi:MAG: hypothetical protein WB767_12015 [Nocardioides sp.]
MSTEALPRPRQVTLSGWLIVVGSVFTVLFAFQQVSQLGSIESQEAAADAISRPPIEGLGLSVDDVQFFIRLAAFVAAACGAAAAILGYQVLQRSKSARLVLTFIAPFMLVAGMLTSGLAAALVAAAIVMLWAQPARDWFAGRRPIATPAKPAANPAANPAAVTMDSMSDPYPPPQQPVSGSPYGAPQAPVPGGPAAPTTRPGTVLAACLTAMISSGLTAVLLLISVLLFAGNRGDFVDEVEKQLDDMDAGTSIDPSTLADAALVMLVVMAVWSVIVVVLAFLTLRGSNGARITLVVSSAMAGLFSLLGVLAVVPLAITAASIATIVLLFVGGSSEWFASRKANRS